MPTFKISILEKDGVEFFGPTEYEPTQMLNQLGYETDGSGWSCLSADTSTEVKPGRVVINTKFFKLSGFVRHNGFVKRSA